MRILFITNLLPYPLDNGGKIKTYNTLNILSNGNDIDLFSFYESDKEENSISLIKKKFNSLNVVKKILTTNKDLKRMKIIAFKSLFNRLPFVILKYKDKDMISILKENIKNKKYDLVYIDHLQLAVYMDIFAEINCPIYLDQHNCESQILKRRVYESKSYLSKLFSIIEYKKLKRFEHDTIQKVNKVITLSEEDKNFMISKNIIDKNKFSIIPIPINIDYKKSIVEEINERINIIFLGTLSWFPNAQGIEWFIKKVIPKMENKKIDYHLFIVGKDPSSSLKDLCSKYKNITITGYVENVNEYIKISDIMIVPIFIGSGMRVKILEGLGKRIPIISTRVGAEGILVKDNKEILFAENEDEFICKILKLKDLELYKSIQKNGENVFEKEYSINAISKKYLRLFEN